MATGKIISVNHPIENFTATLESDVSGFVLTSRRGDTIIIRGEITIPQLNAWENKQVATISGLSGITKIPTAYGVPVVFSEHTTYSAYMQYNLGKMCIQNWGSSTIPASRIAFYFVIV